MDEFDCVGCGREVGVVYLCGEGWTGADCLGASPELPIDKFNAETTEGAQLRDAARERLWPTRRTRTSPAR